MAGKNRLDALQAEAEALAQVEEIRVAVREDIATSDTATAVKALVPGAGISPTKSNNDADKFPTLYHAYDGRAVQMPMYQVEDRLKRRFPDSDEVPEEYRGKQVWLIRPPKTETVVYEFQCRLSPKADPEVLAEIRAAGLQPTCRKKLKNSGFPTQFEADEHFRKKHPRRWAAYQRYLSTAASKDSADSLKAAVAAMLSLAEANKPRVEE